MKYRLVAVLVLWGVPATSGAQVASAAADAACQDSSGVRVSRGVVAGTVLDRGDSSRVAGARVVARWPGALPEMRSAETRADARGRYRLCGLPVDTPLFLRADDGDRGGESAPMEVSVSKGGTLDGVDLLVDRIEADSARPASASASESEAATAPAPLDAAGARTISLSRYNAAAGRGTLVGIVTAKEGGQPLPYADLSVSPFGVMAFTSSEGLFRLTQVPAGRIQLRVRRIGSAPATIAATISAERTDTVRIALSTIALQLDRVRVADAVCPGRAAGTIDSSIVTILQQTQLNAERSRLLAVSHPFEMILQRLVANEDFEPFTSGRRVIVDTVQLDTISATLEHGWRYAPGALIRPGVPIEDKSQARKLGGVPERMVVPQLVDFAEPAFVAAHCFRYAGVTSLDGRRMLRVDFEPTKGIPEPDVRGSLYFDTLSYQIQRSTLYVERPSPRKAGDFWVTRVDTWFKEVAASLPVIDRIMQRTTLRPNAPGQSQSGQAATEEQRLIRVRFLGRAPEL